MATLRTRTELLQPEIIKLRLEYNQIKHIVKILGTSQNIVTETLKKAREQGLLVSVEQENGQLIRVRDRESHLKKILKSKTNKDKIQTIHDRPIRTAKQAISETIRVSMDSAKPEAPKPPRNPNYKPICIFGDHCFLKDYKAVWEQ